MNKHTDEHLGPRNILNVKILYDGLTLKIVLMFMGSVYFQSLFSNFIFDFQIYVIGLSFIVKICG
jgi:hypothetical protein